MATYYNINITYTKDGISTTKAIKYFKALPTEISVYGNGSVGINAETAYNSGIYGINGTFFKTREQNRVYGVAINAGAIANINTYGEYGGDNNHPDLDSYMLCTYQSIEGSTMFIANKNTFPYNANTKNIYVSDCRWAIGGHHLRLNSSFSSKNNFISALSSGAFIYNPTIDDERSFIGYGNGYVYLCTCHNGCDFYDEHLILKMLGCSMGMNIDGGGSALISHKGGHAQVDAQRYVATMLRVNY